MDRSKTLATVSQFLFECIDENEPGNFIIVDRGEEGPNLYFQFSVSNDENCDANGELVAEVVGPQFSETGNPEDVVRFGKLLESGWRHEEHGNAAQVFASLASLAGVSKAIEETMDAFLSVYPCNGDDGWRVRINE